MQGADSEFLQRFEADFAKLVHNREKIPLEELTTRYRRGYLGLVHGLETQADHWAELYLGGLKFPRSPDDVAGNLKLDRDLGTIRWRAFQPGGQRDQWRKALVEDLDMDGFITAVWMVYDQCERDAYLPYWRRHCRWAQTVQGPRIYNDIIRMIWTYDEAWPLSGGYWSNPERTRFESRWPPQIGQEART